MSIKASLIDKLNSGETNNYTFEDLVSIMELLRGEDGCPRAAVLREIR